MKKELTHMIDKQGYRAMFFLLDYFWETNQDQFDFDLPGLLGDMALLEDGMPADEAQWWDWKECASQNTLTESEAFEATMCFLDNYRKRGEAGGGEEVEINGLIDMIRSSPDSTRQKWLECVEKALSE
jgi:hypothetical protein